MIEIFGHLANGEPIHRVTLQSEHVKVQLITLGAAIQTLQVPDRNGEIANVVLGFDNLADYVARSPHFGAVPGRYAGRIDHGRFALDGTAYQLNINKPPHTLHGGFNGFGRRNWAIADHGPTEVTFTLHSPDGEEGFPATLEASACYRLGASSLSLVLSASTDKPTVINLTNHAYFNLAGEGSGSVFGHQLTVMADTFLPIRADGIPTGEQRPVDGTPFDFRTPQIIGERIRVADPQLLYGQGYDHGFLIAGAGFRTAATLTEPKCGRVLTVRTTQPAVQVYTGNSLDGTLSGSSGHIYRSGDAICLEAQHGQDSPNHPHFPSTTLRPGERFKETIEFGFTTQA